MAGEQATSSQARDRDHAMHEIHRFAFKSDQSLGSESSYFRTSGIVSAGDNGQIHFGRHASISSLTLYNGFSLDKWHRYCSIKDLHLVLSGQGIVQVELIRAHKTSGDSSPLPEPAGANADHFSRETLLSERVDLGSSRPPALEVPEDVLAQPGILFVVIRAEEEGQLSYGAFVTASNPRRDVKLGIVITHYKRQRQVQSAAERIRAGLLEAVDTGPQVDLTIVDNSSDCGVVPEENLTVIPNANYGGSGGFSRGLLHLWDRKDITHVLFMDDDASCEMTSIRRTLSVLAYARDTSLAVAGTLMYDSEPSRIYEKGAVFRGICRRIHPDLDLGQERNLLLAEEEPAQANYGGWWFFAFSKQAIQHFPFPFFVRGDDVSFAIANALTIFTTNGIASYGEPFESKHNLRTGYLDTRAHLVEQIILLRHNRLLVCAGATRFFLKSLLSFNYAAAEVSLLALQDVARGTAFFVENLDMSARFAALRDIEARYPLKPVSFAECKPQFESHRNESVLRLLCRTLTVNGILLPQVLRRKGSVYQKNGFHASLKDVFLYRQIYYDKEAMESGELAVFSWRQTLRLWGKFTLRTAAFALGFSRIRRDYIENAPDIMSHEFWRTVYGSYPEHDHAPG